MTYPYECLKCEHRWEVDKPLAEIECAEPCPECGGESKRLIASFSQPVMYDPKNMDPKEIWIKRKHKRHIEEHIKQGTGRIVDFDSSREKLPEFRPEIPRSSY